MRVRMRVDVSGSRNGVKWPPRGQVAEFDDTEGAQLCAAGIATPVPDDDVEKAVPSKEDVETRDDDVDTLRKQAEAVGVKVDKRWGPDKLRAELAARKNDDA